MRQLDDPLKKKKLFLVKVSFLVIVGLLVSAMQLYLTNRPISPPPLNTTRPVTQNHSTVLGAKTQEELVIALSAELENIKKQLSPLSDNFTDEAVQIGGTAIDQGQELFSDTAENVKEKALDATVSTIIEPIITQIQNLPEKEQNQIKEAICK